MARAVRRGEVRVGAAVARSSQHPHEHPLLALQRDAGNAAVTALVQREDDAAGEHVLPRERLEDAKARQPKVAAIAAVRAGTAFPESRLHQQEHGGVIYRDQKGRMASTATRISDAIDTVDIGVHDANASCPAGTQPVGYWHTHPLAEDPLTKEPRKRLEGDAAFSPGDVQVAKQHQLAAFVQDQFGFHALSVEAWFDPWTFTEWAPPKIVRGPSTGP